MAISTTPAEAPVRAPVAPKGKSAPLWIFGMYLAGLVLVYTGERVLSGVERGAGAVTSLGSVLALASTVLRFSPRFRRGGERRSIESLLAGLSVAGLLGLLIYFATSDFGAARLGLERLPIERRTRIEELARVIWVSLIAVSVVTMVFAETALRPMRNAERPESRRVRSAAAAGLALTMAGIYGSLFVYAASGLGWKADYSYFKTSKASESTRQLVKSITGDPIRVVAFFPEVNEVRAEVESYLRAVVKDAPKLKLEVHDRLLVPKLAKELRVTQDGVIILSRGGVNQTLNVGAELEKARGNLKTLDRDFQEQLVKIARARRTAYLTVGHGELNDSARARSDAPGRSAQVIRTLLQKQNFVVKDLGLGQGLANDVPDDASVVLVLGPTAPLSREELAALGRYGERGGKLILALDADAIASSDSVAGAGVDSLPASPAPAADMANAPPAGGGTGGTPGTQAPVGAATTQAASSAAASVHDALARVVGLKFSGEVLANEKQHVRVRYNDSDRTRLVSNTFSSHASVSTLSRNAPRAAVVMFGAGSLALADGSKAKVDFTVRSMAGTFQDLNRDYSQQSDKERAEVFNLAAAVTRPLSAPAAAAAPAKPEPGKKAPPKEEPKEMRAFVITDADAFSDFVMGEVVGNQVLFVDAVRWLAGDESVQGLPNTEEDVRIEHTKQGDLGWFYATIFGAPSLVLGIGLLISRRSRASGVRR